MNKEHIQLIQEFLTKVRSANKEATKKEAFKDLLNRLYSKTPDIAKIIDAMTLGAERNVVNIPRKDKIHRGSADTLYSRVIIEYENDLRISLNHAKEQLAGYMLGQFKSGEGYNYTLIASDFINWKIFAPTLDSISLLDTLQEHQVILEEVDSAFFTLTLSNAEDFYFWMDRYLFREEKQTATLKRIEEAFGYQSPVFIESFRQLSIWFDQAKQSGEVQVSFEQWQKFLSVAYGSFDASEANFLIHTYLSIFSKMLAYSIVSNDDYIDEKEQKAILDGSIFFRYNIRNFVDNDFFHWVKADENFHNLKKVFRLLAQEISLFDFHSVEEDVLKGVYQELIDLDTRHALGEYYTPDWLCERVLEEYSFEKSARIIDPSCGSGSFLRAAIHRMRRLHPNLNVEELSAQIYGIDIHPLSVQIAKTTLLIALGKGVVKARRPIHLNIILANTLLAPEGVQNLFGGEFRMKIDRQVLDLNTQVLEDVVLFDEALEICEELAEQTLNKKVEPRNTFENILKSHYKKGGYNTQIVDSFYAIYQGLKTVKEQGRDSIWKFIVQNSYKPYFLSKKFDYVVGNPPWFTYSSIKNAEYQNTLNDLAAKYDVKPERIANFPNLEIAAIFLAHCASYFLKPGGQLAFVVPRSFLNADHHDNTRSGRSKGFRILQTWDLEKVTPLFNIPSAVLFVQHESGPRKISTAGIPGIKFRGTVPSHNCNLKMAFPKLSEELVRWFYKRQGTSSALSTTDSKNSKKLNPYKKLFKKGAEITPRTFYFIELCQEQPEDWQDRVINIKTADAVKPDSKAPWKGIELDGRIESRFLFRTALSKSILPFSLFKPDLIALPISIHESHGKKLMHLHSVDHLREEGYLNASKWFGKCEENWRRHRTEKNKKIGAIEYLNWHNKLVGQDLNTSYLVIYNSNAKDANAAVIDRADLDLQFIADFKEYIYCTDDKQEANYLAAILNSTILNERIKDFQTKGLFGARDIHKKILDIYFPKYNSSTRVHQRLAELAKGASEKSKSFLTSNVLTNIQSPGALGRLRTAVKLHLKDDFDQINALVISLIT